MALSSNPYSPRDRTHPYFGPTIKLPPLVQQAIPRQQVFYSHTAPSSILAPTSPSTVSADILPASTGETLSFDPRSLLPSNTVTITPINATFNSPEEPIFMGVEGEMKVNNQWASQMGKRKQESSIGLMVKRSRSGSAESSTHGFVTSERTDTSLSSSQTLQQQLSGQPIFPSQPDHPDEPLVTFEMCTYCEQNFSSESLADHMLKDHLGSLITGVSSCSSCDTVYKTETEFVSHFSTDHTINLPTQTSDTADLDQLCECLLCGVQFTGNKDSHWYQHQGPSHAFRCRFCQSLISTRSLFIDHLKNVHLLVKLSSSQFLPKVRQKLTLASSSSTNCTLLIID